jgi:hypothetical protein
MPIPRWRSASAAGVPGAIQPYWSPRPFRQSMRRPRSTSGHAVQHRSSAAFGFSPSSMGFDGPCFSHCLNHLIYSDRKGSDELTVLAEDMGTNFPSPLYPTCGKEGHRSRLSCDVGRLGYAARLPSPRGDVVCVTAAFDVDPGASAFGVARGGGAACPVRAGASNGTPRQASAVGVTPLCIGPRALRVLPFPHAQRTLLVTGFRQSSAGELRHQAEKVAGCPAVADDTCFFHQDCRSIVVPHPVAVFPPVRD